MYGTRDRYASSRRYVSTRPSCTFRVLFLLFSAFQCVRAVSIKCVHIFFLQQYCLYRSRLKSFSHSVYMNLCEQSNRKKSLTKERQQPTNRIRIQIEKSARSMCYCCSSLVRRSHTQCQSGPSVFSYTCECGLILYSDSNTHSRKKISSHSFGRVCFCSCTLGILIFIYLY